MPKHIKTAVADQILIITLNRTHAHNALIPALLTEVIEALDAARGAPDIRAVVLQANGTAFSIGGDIHGFKQHFPDIRDYALDIVGKLNQMMLAMIDLPQPIVTAIHGVVTGGSLGFVLASDLVLVSPQAVFKAHYASAGFSPDGGWGVLLPRIIGARRSAECLLLNQSFSAQQAVEWGVANRVVEQAGLRDEALKMAHKIARYPSGTMCNSKQLLWRERDQIAADLETERQKFVQQIQHQDAHDGVLRFLETFKDYPKSDESSM
jgi:2-(1,2-epoxy-1,2-dihydrophenyl)acetyl-CoA isomerase